MKILLSLVMLSSFHLKAETLTFRADNWCPFNCEPNTSMPGYVVEILNNVFNKAGHKIDYQILAWNRALTETQEGKFTAVIAASEKELANGVNTVSIGSSKNCFFVKRGSTFKFNGLESLKGHKVSIIKDYKYGDEIDAEIAKRPDGFDAAFGDNPLVSNIRKLQADRTEIVLENDTVFSYTSSMEKLLGKFISAGCLPDDKLFVSFSGKNPKSAEYVKIFNEGLEAMRKSGELKPILEKYGVTDWK